ncbi:MAG: lasso peptide biosynthesis B2 protein [Burkholderiales bacterium]
MSSRLARFLVLPAAEKRVFVCALLLLPLVRAGLRVRGFARMREWAAAAHGAPSDAGCGPGAARIGALVAAAGSVLPGVSTCLARSLLLVRLLGRRGLRGELRIGVRRTESGIESHAWVELRGAALNDAQGGARRYAVFELPRVAGGSR